MNEFKKKLEQGEISKYDIKQMLSNEEITLDDILGLLKNYARQINCLKELLKD